ncbi:Rossmann-fold NAD(P)-binding domain-containing protein [Pontibacillus litoralis]|uniref:NAD(P)-binding domain-containing protein n=1 Tax=Pontibacillus litoralis JSM 072002 TaxID=1385512 RepID=A0A0A5HRJ4_9BACI|nr:hypothetical protein [Pontibacillus litoralis]KGX86252.1 hypothetical protein N784_05675 [Pontibacillus litoralis JSM 072002]
MLTNDAYSDGVQAATKQPVVAIFGVHMNIGLVMLKRMAHQYSIIAITPPHANVPFRIPVTKRACDVYNDQDIEKALFNVDFAIYIHGSMQVDAACTQANDDDLQLIVADNIARAAERQQVKKLIFIQPPSTNKELRETMTAYRTPVHIISKNYSTPPSTKSKTNDVRSVQRLSFSNCHMKAHEIAREYMAWLDQSIRPLIRVRQIPSYETTIQFRAFTIPLLTLQISQCQSTKTRITYRIIGGLLNNSKASKEGRFEFRTLQNGRNCIIIAIHDFHPALPWPLYKRTQAPIHLFVMKQFATHIYRKSCQHVFN